jgi:hypothetical protein
MPDEVWHSVRKTQNINNKKSFGEINDYKKARQEGRRGKCIRKVTKDLF